MSKFFLVAFMVLITSTLAFADASVTPPFLKDATITVTLKSGKTYTFSANDHAVVRREKSARQTIVVEKLVEKECKITESQTRAAKPNRLRVFGGRGPDGIKTSESNGVVTLSPSQGAVGGFGYDRSLNDDVSIGGQVMSNETITLGLGLDF